LPLGPLNAPRRSSIVMSSGGRIKVGLFLIASVQQRQRQVI
jgi:hypothetical protein